LEMASWIGRSKPSNLHSHTINGVFFPSSRLYINPLKRKYYRWLFFLRRGFELRWFSSYPQQLSCPAHALSDNRYARGYVALFLSYWEQLPLKQPPLQSDRDRPVSRRSNPAHVPF